MTTIAFVTFDYHRGFALHHHESIGTYLALNHHETKAHVPILHQSPSEGMLVFPTAKS